MNSPLRVNTHFEPPLGHRPGETEQESLIFGCMGECHQSVPQIKCRFDGSPVMGATKSRRDIFLWPHPFFSTPLPCGGFFAHLFLGQPIDNIPNEDFHRFQALYLRLQRHEALQKEVTDREPSTYSSGLKIRLNTQSEPLFLIVYNRCH